MKTTQETNAAVKSLFPFIGRNQLRVLVSNASRSEERDYFRDKLCEMASIVESMPKTYEQESKGQEAVAHLHYFTASADFFITEKDAGTPFDSSEDAQSQAFGLADIFRDGGELGYISLPELLAAGAEIDLHFTPKTLREIAAKRYPKAPIRSIDPEVLAFENGEPPMTETECIAAEETLLAAREENE